MTIKKKKKKKKKIKININIFIIKFFKKDKKKKKKKNSENLDSRINGSNKKLCQSNYANTGSKQLNI